MGRNSRSKERRPPQIGPVEGRKKTAVGANAGYGLLSRPSLTKKWLFAAALVAAIFLVYRPAWHGGFIWDDDLHLVNNPVLKTGGLAGAWTPGGYLNYWPLTFTVFRLEFEAWGLNVLGFHLVNIALHAVAALLVWQVLVELEVPGAMLAAAIFALHPVNVESVAWITQLKGLLSLLFALVSALFYLKFDRATWGRASRPVGTGRGRWWLYTGALVAFFLSTLSKGMVITLPVVLLACAWWRRGSLQWRDLARIAPYLLIAALMAGVEVWTQHAEDGVRNDSILSRIAVAGRAVWFYFSKVLWPVNLCFAYRRWKIGDGDALSYLPALLLAVLFALALWRRRTWGRPVVMMIVCYVGLLLPALGFVNIYYMRYSLVADHWQYAATIVPCAVLTGAAAAWTFRRPERPRVAYALAISLLAVLAGLSWRQSRMYTDLETVWNDTLAKEPNSWLAHYNLASALAGRGQTLEAIPHYQKALEIKPDDALGHYDFGNALAGRERLAEAIVQYRMSLELKPDFALAHNNLGLALASSGHMDEAIDHYRKALEFKPDNAAAHINLGNALRNLGQIDEAVDQYRKALDIRPDDALARHNLAAALAARGKLEAIANCRKALEMKPDDPIAHNNLANALVGGGKFEEAIAQYRQALQIKYPSSELQGRRRRARPAASLRPPSWERLGFGQIDE
jgi:protein O-mannosyl-transferase